MAKGFRVGDTAYIVENGLRISAVTIVSYAPPLYTIRFPNGLAHSRVRASRLYPTKEAARYTIRDRIASSKLTRYWK